MLGLASRAHVRGKVLGGLADLPIAIDQCRRERRIDLRSAERRKSQHCTTTDVRLVVTRIENDRQASLVADGAERSDGGFAYQWVGSGCTQFAQQPQHVVVDNFLFARCPRRRLYHQ